MTEPTYDPTTERVYARLPEFYRTMDEQVDWQFKKFISAAVTSLFDIDLLTARIEYIPPENRADYYASLNAHNTYERTSLSDDHAYNESVGYNDQAYYDGSGYTEPPIGETSDLIDGTTADAEWLPYIGQLIGADLSHLTNDFDRRDAVVRNYLGFRAGSREALENAAKQVLTGTKYVRVYPHRDGSGDSIYSIGTEWDVLLITKTEETVSGQSVIDEIVRKGAKPAGVVLHHLLYTATWDNIESLFATWTLLETNGGTWANIELGNADLLPE